MKHATRLFIPIVGLLVCVTAVAETTRLSLYTAQGELITDVEGTLRNADGDLLKKLPPRPDGTWTVDINALGKYGVAFQGSGGITALDFQVAPEVPGQLELQLPAPRPEQVTPANDQCDTAVWLGIPDSAAGDTSQATFTGPFPFCGTSHTAPELWYAVVGDGTVLTATTCNQASYDTKISVYCGTCDTNICVTGNDDDFAGGCGLTSTATWCSSPGFVYYVMVHGFSSDAGTFELDLTSNGLSCPDAVGCEVFPEDGACCLCDCNDPPTASCVLTDEFFVSCDELGGTFQGHGTACFELEPDVVYSDSPALVIPDGGPPITTQIAVPAAESCLVGDVDVELQITGTFIGDLLIEVTSPADTTVVLWPNSCTSFDNFNATADDDGTATLCLDIASGPSNAVFYDPAATGAPDTDLGVIEGQQSGGAWTLQLEDTFAGDTHVLDFWALHIACAQPSCPDSACATTPPLPDDETDDDDEGSEDEVELFTIPEPPTPTRLQAGGPS